MGLSGLLLKRKDEMDPLKAIGDVSWSAKKSDLFFILYDKFYYNEDGTFRFTSGFMTNKYTESKKLEEIIVYIEGKPESIYDTEFDFLVPNGKLSTAVFFEAYSDCERILLKFVSQYLTINPKDIFWGGLDWYYTLEDIEIIRKREFDWNWPYIKPDWK